MSKSSTFSPAQEAFVSAYMSERRGKDKPLDRVVSEPAGLRPEEMMSALSHPGLEDRGLEVMADFMHPDDSMYFDAIFGAQYGQKAIRTWLLPTMDEISFIEFRPQRESVLIESESDGDTVMIDEWMMVATIEGNEIPLSPGISVRRFRDGWITSVTDIYDTVSTRTPPPADMPLPAGMSEQAPLPDYPEMNWPLLALPAQPPLSAPAQAWIDARVLAHPGGGDLALDQPSGLSADDLHAIHNHPTLGRNWNLMADLMHPTDSVYIDPIFGRFEGQKAIRGWMTDIMGKIGDIDFEPISEIYWNGETSLQLWKQVANTPDGEQQEMSWGASVRQFKDGWLVYCADYFDAISLQKPEVQAAGQAAGSTITVEDIIRYRPELAGLQAD
jgi:ketosteroid isomerase-like protein